jgi:glycosyltransferase involved in cell wall biosynthesis
MKRIGIDIRKLEDFGIGTYIENLVKNLSLLDRENEYRLFCRRARPPGLSGLGPNFGFVHDASPGYSLREHISLPIKARREKLDLFHSPHYVLPFFLPCPAVATVHDVIHLRFPEYLPGLLAKHYARFFIGRAVSRAARVITSTESAKNDLMEIFKTPGEKIAVIPCAVDESFLRERTTEEKNAVRRRYGLDFPFVLYAGNFKRHKNLERLLQAFDMLRRNERFRTVRLVLIGGTFEATPFLAAERERLRLGDAVRCLGKVPSEEVPAIFQMASAFAFPSLYEGFGLPPLEALASGVPVLTSNVSSLPEVVGDAALLVDPTNVDEISEGLRTLLEDETLRDKLIPRGKERARLFSWKETARRVLDVYTEIDTL